MAQKKNLEKTIKKVAIATEQKSPITLSSLRNWNLALAVLYALQGVAIILFSTARSFPVSVNYLASDPLQTAAQHKTVLALATHHLFAVNVLYVLLVVFFVAAAMHLLFANRYQSRYQAQLEQGTNKLRWIAYAVIESLLMATIGLLAGIQDAAVLVALIGFSVIKNLCGWAIERGDIGGNLRQKLQLGVGGVAGVAAPLIVSFYLFASTINGGSAPGYLYGLFVTSLLAFGAYAANIFLRHRQHGKWADYHNAERVYMILGLVVTSLLAWQIFAGALR